MNQPYTIKKSPFDFLKSLVVIEFFFALLPFVAVLLLPFREAYEGATVASSVPFSLVLTLAMTTLQVLIIGITFTTWYFPAYIIDDRHIIHIRANLFEDKTLANTPTITNIAVKQGRLAKRLNYGTLEISCADQPRAVYLRNIADPDRVRQQLEAFMMAEPTSVEMPVPRSVGELISGGENQHVEFKASLVWDYHQQRSNKNLYEPVMKNLVAFMNSTGGFLVIGVADDGKVLGLDPDLQTLGKPNLDGFENIFNMAFNSMIGAEYRRFVELTFPKIDGERLCLAMARPSTQPVYLVHKGTETFYIRAGNGTQPLPVSKATKYIQSRYSGDGAR